MTAPWKQPGSRRLTDWLSIVAVALSVLAVALASRTTSLRAGSVSPYLHENKASSPSSDVEQRTLVGNRKFAPFYSGCSSSELLRNFKDIKVDKGGLAAIVPDNQSFALEDFDYSFDWPAPCPRPHVYTAAEACDLVSAFGGIFLSGDSLTRNLVNALFIILRNREDGAVYEAGDKCFGDSQFDDKRECRLKIVVDSHQSELREPVCGGDVQIRYYDTACPIEPGEYIPRYLDWRSGVPSAKTALSTIIYNSFGLHCHLLASISINGAIKPITAFMQSSYPRPINLWGSVHAPGSNKPPAWLVSQGAESVQGYNAQMEADIAKVKTGSILDGATGWLDFYGMTDGAKSFDGTHYMYQINMEKAHLFLNLMDVLWTEAKRDGGLWDMATLCPDGQRSYQCEAFRYYNRKGLS